MTTTSSRPRPKFRRPLNTHQIQLLITLYKFHFATTYHIAKSQGSKYPRVILARLRVLVDQGYIGQNYDSSYNIKGKPGTYYLRPEGIAYFKQQSYASSKAIRGLYRDKRATEPQIAHYLHVFTVYVEFKRLYPEVFQFFSKRELAEWKHVPELLPDAYLSRNNKGTTIPNDFFLDCFEEATAYPKLINRVRKYIAYAEDKTWEKAKKTQTPVILMVCETKALQRRLFRLVARELDNSYATITFLAITTEVLMSAQSTENALWNDAADTGKTFDLNNLYPTKGRTS